VSPRGVFIGEGAGDKGQGGFKTIPIALG